jgi:hypothetical protein
MYYLNILVLLTLLTSCASSEFRGYSKTGKICAQDPETKKVFCEGTPKYRNGNDYFTETNYDINQIRRPD